MPVAASAPSSGIESPFLVQLLLQGSALYGSLLPICYRSNYSDLAGRGA